MKTIKIENDFYFQLAVKNFFIFTLCLRKSLCVKNCVSARVREGNRFEIKLRSI